MARFEAVAGLGLTVALGVGTAYAVNEVGELNAKANRVEACLAYYDTHEIPSDACGDPGPLSSAEAQTLKDTADTFGNLGWLAFFGTIGAGGATLEHILRMDD